MNVRDGEWKESYEMLTSGDRTAAGHITHSGCDYLRKTGLFLVKQVKTPVQMREGLRDPTTVREALGN